MPRDRGSTQFEDRSPPVGRVGRRANRARALQRQHSRRHEALSHRVASCDLPDGDPWLTRGFCDNHRMRKRKRGRRGVQIGQRDRLEFAREKVERSCVHAIRGSYNDRDYSACF